MHIYICVYIYINQKEMGLIIRELNFQSLPTLKQNGHKFWVVFRTNNKKKLSLSLKVYPFFSMINRAEK